MVMFLASSLTSLSPSLAFSRSFWTVVCKRLQEYTDIWLSMQDITRVYGQYARDYKSILTWHNLMQKYDLQNIQTALRLLTCLL